MTLRVSAAALTSDVHVRPLLCRAAADPLLARCAGDLLPHPHYPLSVPPLELASFRNGVVLLLSPQLSALDVPHAFTTRIGGVSQTPFDTLNLAGIASSGGIDDETHRQENHRRVLEALGCPEHRWAGLHLVHGSDVIVHEPAVGSDLGHLPPSLMPEGDAICTRQPGWMLKATSADCVTIILASTASPAVAVVHAGWRGVVGGIVARTVEVMERRLEAPSSALVAAIGPCISAVAFEVGEEVAAAFEAAQLGAHVLRRPEWTRPHIDLHRAAEVQLRTSGVRADAIDGEPLCTLGNPELFFSHRRDQGRTGRMAAIVAIESP